MIIIALIRHAAALALLAFLFTFLLGGVTLWPFVIF